MEEHSEGCIKRMRQQAGLDSGYTIKMTLFTHEECDNNLVQGHEVTFSDYTSADTAYDAALKLLEDLGGKITLEFPE